jgi:aryl-alcohol dehydrogenase-like predicted oxidoreductase
MVSRLGLGCMSMSATYGEGDDAVSIQALHAALEADTVFWDTADVYGSGKNELLLARVLGEYRERVVLASKCGITGKNADGLTLNGRPDYIAKSCENTLKRLQTDHLDLYYLHRIDPDVPVEESVGAMGELVNRGLVRYVGLSEAGAETIQRAHSEYPLSAVQSEYSLLTRGAEETVLPKLRELGIGLVAYSPLGRGYLTGDIKSSEDLSPSDFRRELPRFTDENLARNYRLVERVSEVARARGNSVAQVALAWLLAQPGVIPIPGTKRPERVFENAESCKTPLSTEELLALDFSEETVSGARYPDWLQRAVGL